MKKVLFTAATLVALSFTIASCGSSDCFDCTGNATYSVIGKYCQSQYPSAAASVITWANYKAVYIAAGCKQV